MIIQKQILKITNIMMALGLTACASMGKGEIDTAEEHNREGARPSLIKVEQSRLHKLSLYGVIKTNGEVVVPLNNTALELQDGPDGPRILGRVEEKSKKEHEIVYYGLDGQVLGGSNDLRELRTYGGPEKTRYSIQPSSEFFSFLEQSNPGFAAVGKLPKKQQKMAYQKLYKKFNRDIQAFIDPMTDEPMLVLHDEKTKQELALAPRNICKSNYSERDVEGYGIALILARDCESGLHGFINPTLDWVVAAQFDFIRTDVFRVLPEKTSHGNPVIIGVGYTDEDREKYGYDCKRLIISDGTVSKPREFDLESGHPNANLLLAKPCQLEADKDHEQYALQPNGFVNRHGEWVLEPVAGRYIQSMPDKKGHISFLDIDSQKMGSMDIKGKIIFPAQFFTTDKEDIVRLSLTKDKAYIEYDQYGWATVSDSKESQNYGFINRKGKWKIPPKLPIDYVSNGFDAKGRAYSKLPNIQGRRIINRKGEDLYPHIPGSFGRMNPFGFAALKSVDDCNCGLSALINEKGEILTPAIFHSIDFLSDSLAVVVIDSQQKNEEGEARRVQGVIDMQGQWVIPAEYQYIKASQDYLLVEKNNQYGILNYQNQWLYPLQDNHLSPLSDGIYFGIPDWDWF